MSRFAFASCPRAPVLAGCALLIALAHSPGARADTDCVNTVTEFINAYNGAENEAASINVVAGTYDFATDPGIAVAYTRDLKIVGGWNSNCTSRQLDPRLTVFTGMANQVSFRSDESIAVESIAFVATGRIVFGAREGAVRLERTWFENACAGDGRCGDAAAYPVLVSAREAHLTQVVVTDNRAGGCALQVNTNVLEQASVQFSLFTENYGHGLCLRTLDGVGTYDYEAALQNNIFWNNQGDDLVTRYSSDLTLRNNVYQSLDTNPAPATLPSQTLMVDPLFQNATNGDFRLQPASPAINTGRFGSIFGTPTQDLDGGARVIGPAPDRGPFESSSTESTFLVTNTLDTTSPVATGSLRWAITQSNATPGVDRIRFALPDCPRVISLSALLPDITDSVFIDGYSQAGSEANASVRGFAPTICIGLRDPSLSLDHALRIPAEASGDTFLWVGGLAFGGFDIAAVRIAAGENTWVFGSQFGGSLGGTALGNNAVNVRLGGTSHEGLIGGLELSQRNLIGSAYVAGVELLANGSGAEGYGNVVRNNFIGLAANGQDAAPNALGVRVRTHRNDIVDNWIGGNTGDGVLIEGELAFMNDVEDNDIGRKTFDFCLPPCTPDLALGNGGAGVRVNGNSDNNSVMFNRIHFNGGAGVRFEDGERNMTFANSISANDGLGIDLGFDGVNPIYNTGLAVTATYANRGINAPLLAAAFGYGSGGTVGGQAVGSNGDYLVQLFRNTSCDASGRGEGLEFLTSEVVTISNASIGANGSANFSIALPPNEAMSGATVTAVLSHDDDHSSEFSTCVSYQTLACRELFMDSFEDSPPPANCTPL